MDERTRALLNSLSTATLTSQLLKRGFRNTFIAGLQATQPGIRLLGTAYTLRYAPSREDMDMSVDYNNDTNVQRIAVESIEEGQVLVIDARGEVSAASFGHIIATRIMRRGAAGLVTDGALRDSHRFGQLDFPAYFRAAHATTSAVLHHPVDLNVPIGCGGVLVLPGDVLVGDPEGIVVIPRAIAPEVAAGAAEQERLEEFIWEKVNAGSPIRGVYPPDEVTRREFDARRP